MQSTGKTPSRSTTKTKLAKRTPDPTVPPSRELQAFDLQNSVGYSLRRAQFSTYKEFNSAMHLLDIRPSQFAVLSLIHANPGLRQSAISSALGIQKTNFVALLDKLEDRGLTERRKLHGDRRSSALYLTETGEAFVTNMHAAHRSMEKKLAQRLGPKRTRQLLSLVHEFTARARPGKI